MSDTVEPAIHEDYDRAKVLARLDDNDRELGKLLAVAEYLDEAAQEAWRVYHTREAQDCNFRELVATPMKRG